MKFSSALLLTFLAKAAFVTANEQKQGLEEEVIVVGKRPPPGAIIFKPPTEESAPEVPPKDQIQPTREEKEPIKEPSKTTKEANEPTQAPKQSKEKNNSKQTTTVVVVNQDDSGKDVPTRLFRPRYRNSGETVSFTMQNLALICGSIFAGILLL